MTPPNWLQGAAGVLNKLLGDFTATWADSAGGATEGGPIAIDPGDELPASGQYLVLVHNPSTVTALTVQPQVKGSFPTAGDQFADLGNGFAVAADDTAALVVDELAFGDGGRLSITNDSALGAGEGFTAEVRVFAL